MFKYRERPTLNGTENVEAHLLIFKETFRTGKSPIYFQFIPSERSINLKVLKAIKGTALPRPAKRKRIYY